MVLPPENRQERQHVGRMNVVCEEAEVEAQPLALRRVCKRADDREAIMAVPASVNRGLPSRRPGAATSGVQQKAALVEENDGGVTLPRFFLAGARSACASGQWLTCPACGHGAGAAVGSRLVPATAATHAQDDSSPQSAGELPRLPADRSTTPWGILPCRTLSGAWRSARPSVYGRASAWDLDAAWHATLGTRRAAPPVSSGGRRRVQLRVNERFRGRLCLGLRACPPGGGDIPVGLHCLWVSCLIYGHFRSFL
jgi:hypothetical protein